ncbi:MAG: hypothetical protein JJ992_06565, partial [Planctomycetes bacterium]|nr:hypothetical protein [Planctomycetota bacterium]
MHTEDDVRRVMEEFLERTLEPRIRHQFQSGEIVTQEDFDDALSCIAGFQGVLAEWEDDLKQAVRNRVVVDDLRH